MESNIAEKSIKRKQLSWLLDQPVDTKFEILKHHLNLSVVLINEILQEEVTEFCGERYCREKPYDSQYSRWGYNQGSVKIGNHRVPIDVPRIWDNTNEHNKPLENYQQLKENEAISDSLVKQILYGITTRDFHYVTETLLDSFGLSRSSVSNEFKKGSAEKLQQFCNRRLDEYNFIAVFIDGKYLAREQMVIVLGVTDRGDKIPLDFIQTHSENHQSIRDLLVRLIERGFGFEDGILVIIDGSKGIEKAVNETFGHRAIIQRCQYHKRENIVSYLNDEDSEKFSYKLKQAYAIDNYEEAKERLLTIRDELQPINISAARSLEEGLEQTLTLHRLGVVNLFRTSFSTTNCIENINSILGKHINKVKYWMNSDQRYRWIGYSLLEIEKRMRKVNNYKKLDILKQKIKKEVEIKEKNQYNK